MKRMVYVLHGHWEIGDNIGCDIFKVSTSRSEVEKSLRENGKDGFGYLSQLETFQMEYNELIGSLEFVKDSGAYAKFYISMEEVDFL